MLGEVTELGLLNKPDQRRLLAGRRDPWRQLLGGMAKLELASSLSGNCGVGGLEGALRGHTLDTCHMLH
jgi:hypothetical protein